MANSDKNILITPNISAATGVYPTIKFNGANNTPINLSVLDDGTISFSSTAGQLFSISDGLTGTIFSVNDISGIPSIEVLDTGLVKINQYGGSTVFGSSAAIQNASSVNAKVSISTVSATTPGLIIKGVSSQSANLQEWQSSDGTVLSNIGPNGTVTLKSIASSNIATFFNGTNGYGAGNINYAGTFNINGANMGFPYTSSGAVLAVNATYAGSLPISVRGYASQTADLQQWQNSAGTVLARVLYNGNIESPIVSAGSLFAQNGDLSVAYGGYFGGGVGGNYIGAAVSVIPWTTTTIGVIVRGRASQSADLQQWQNSAGTVLANVDANGKIAAPIFQSTVAGTAYIVTGSNNNAIRIQTNGTTNVGLIIRGEASQTANLQEWQDSAGTVLARIRNDGVVIGPELRTTNNRVMAREENSGGTLTQIRATTTADNPGTNLAKIYFRDGTNAGTLKLVVIAGASGAETTILDNIPQS